MSHKIEKHRAAGKAYYDANKAHVLAKNKRWKDAHKEERQAQWATYYKDNAEEYCAKRRAAWANKHQGDKQMRSRGSHLRERYGITLEEYDEMSEAQGGVCAACGKTNGSKLLAVDHDHKTSEVRGLLCNNCNTALGRVDDNIDTLMALVRYLERYYA
jgi:hypothetical protein